jgi:methionyl-tRNA synthetase
MAEPFFITTAIDYTNAPPHIGHAYEKVLADVIARYRRLLGDDVFFLTGVDQHGQKVQQSAEQQGIPPQEFVNGITAKFRALWARLHVDYSHWAATTDPRHKAVVRNILGRLNDSGHIYKAKRAGHYSIRQEQFLTDKERNPDGQFGPEWGQVEFREEENYYFKLAEHKQWLLDFIERRSQCGRPFVIPEFRVAELRNAAEKLEGDLCISRPRERLSWGIPFPFDENFVTYVWFDALVNYISFAPAYDPKPDKPPQEFLRWWRTVIHVIGKDILIPAHGVYWPIMLKALGFSDDDMPTLLVHGWWNHSGAKMSKSLGNIVDPHPLAESYGVDAVRYYLVADIATGRDADFSEDRLIQRYNSDLANSLGNLLNRTLNMAWKYREGVLRRSISAKFEPLAGELIQRYQSSLRAESHFSIQGAVAQVTALCTEANQHIEQTGPWRLSKLEKEGDATAKGQIDSILYALAETLRISAILLSPILPEAAHGIFDQLNWMRELKGNDSRFALENARWGALPDGHLLGKPTPLFPRIEAKPAAGDS